MLLTGTHPRTLDDKKRLVLPKRVREQLGDTNQLLVAKGLDQCLWIFDRAKQEKLSAKLDESSSADADARAFERIFFASMETVDIDKTGRVLIPDGLIEFAGLKHEVVLLGVRDRLEVWDAERWNAFNVQHAPRFDAVAAAAFRK